MGAWSKFLGSLIKETDVRRDRRGRTESKPPDERRLDEIRAYARRVRTTEDRIGPPVRFTPDINNWWYMVKGPQRWIRQTDQPGWHHGFYYTPGRWGPVVPPRADWPSRTAYSSPPGCSRGSVVPDMVRAASGLTASGVRGYRFWDGSARQEAKRTGRSPDAVAYAAAGERSTKRGVTTVRKKASRPLEQGTVTRSTRKAPPRPSMKSLVSKAKRKAR